MMYLIGYNQPRVEIRQTPEYRIWFEKLSDARARSKILIRLRRVSLGNFGDVKPVGEGVSELRISYGPGYRIYMKRQGGALVILLVGGDKSSQKYDIKKAKEFARHL